MKIRFGLLLICAYLAASASSAQASNTATSFSESATIVPGTTVSAYVVGSNVVTVVNGSDAHAGPAYPVARRPLIELSLQTPDKQNFVRYVTWDRYRRRLTINL